MAELHPTRCCALSQLTCNDFEDKKDIKKFLDKIKEELKINYRLLGYGGGERALFVITREVEERLIAQLKSLKFESITTFNRRNGLGDELLTMWMYKI